MRSTPLPNNRHEESLTLFSMSFIFSFILKFSSHLESFCFFVFWRFYLFMSERDREHKLGGAGEVEVGSALSMEPIMGLYPRTLGWWPELKADDNWATQVPQELFLNIGTFCFTVLCFIELRRYCGFYKSKVYGDSALKKSHWCHFFNSICSFCVSVTFWQFSQEMFPLYICNGDQWLQQLRIS